MVEFLLTHIPTLSVTEEKTQIYFGKNRTHNFRTSRCAGYLLLKDHSGDKPCMIKNAKRMLSLFSNKIVGVRSLLENVRILTKKKCNIFSTTVVYF